MKIIHVIFSMQVGGAETMLVDVLNEQIQNTHGVKLVIINDDIDQELIKKINSKVQIIKLGRRKGYNSVWVGLKFNFLILKESPDVIHFHDHNGINFLLNKSRYKTLLTLHALGFETTNWHKYTKLSAISKIVQKDIYIRSGLKSELIYNGINLAKIRKKEKEEMNFRIVQVGRLSHNIKAQDILIRAVKSLQTKYLDLSISLDIIGDGPSSNYLKDLVSTLKVSNVSFLGVKGRAFVYNELANYDLLVQPSNIEGFGLTVVEALAANISVLISDLDGPKEVINNGQYGFIFKVGDSEDCARQLEEILIKGSRKDSKNLEEYLSQNFDVHQTSMKYIELYKTIIEQ